MTKFTLSLHSLSLRDLNEFITKVADVDGATVSGFELTETSPNYYNAIVNVAYGEEWACADKRVERWARWSGVELSYLSAEYWVEA